MSPAPLEIALPGSVTLHSDGTVYRGEFTVTVKNTGNPFTSGQVFVTAPTGIEVEFTAGDPGFNGCTYITGPEYYGCVGLVVPGLGGVVSKVVHLKGNFAPQADEVVLHGFSVRYTVMTTNGGTAPDATPSDNTVALDVILAKP